MAVHIVTQGESLSSIAKKYKLDWDKIYNDPANSDFRQARPNPNVIYPGDSIVIPDLELRQESRPTDQQHVFKRKTTKLMLRIIMTDGTGAPLDTCAYQLEVSGQTYTGTTARNGMIEEEVPPDASDGTLTLWMDKQPQGVSYSWPLQIGYLDPVEYATGVQARLNNLAYGSGTVDGIIGPVSKSAIRAFQKKYQLDIDGIPGPITQSKLKDVYGC